MILANPQWKSNCYPVRILLIDHDTSPPLQSGAVPPRLLQLEAVRKSFGGVPALKPLNLELQAGEALGLVGENGAGKSTLIKILSGVHAPDGGTIRWRNEEVHFRSPHEALAAGIATIHQELAFFGPLTVAENLLMGEPWPRHRWGGIHWSRLYSAAAGRLAEYQIEISPQRLFRELSAAQRQEIAMARALSQKASLLILDEPTASLSEREVEQLFRQLARLRQSRVAMVYVSHRLDEILRLTDQVVVLRDGAVVSHGPTAATTMTGMVRDMVGRPIEQVYPHSRSTRPGEVLLELDEVSRPGLFDKVTFRLRAGEITGLAGLVGSGRSELARAIYGLYPMSSGAMRLGGQPWAPRHPQASLRAGLIYVPEERKRQGLVLEHSLADSISIGFSDLLTRFGLIPRAREGSRVAEVLEHFTIRAANTSQPIGTLSGGNQQKSLLGRWLSRDPQVLILDEPTRGVDVAAKADIHALIDQLAGQGKAVLLISSELPEVIGMSDRILVMCRGKVAAELEGPNLTQEQVILAASGLTPDRPTREGQP